MDRNNVKVVDCTIRDGGLMNNSHFELETVRAVFKACCDAGVDVCELGYHNSKEMFDPAEYGAWRFTEEPDMIAATVPDRGHIPFLDEPEALDALTKWLKEMDA